jgi:uncharacterized membrane-anchored protein
MLLAQTVDFKFPQAITTATTAAQTCISLFCLKSAQNAKKESQSQQSFVQNAELNSHK